MAWTGQAQLEEMQQQQQQQDRRRRQIKFRSVDMPREMLPIGTNNILENDRRQIKFRSLPEYGPEDMVLVTVNTEKSELCQRTWHWWQD